MNNFLTQVKNSDPAQRRSAGNIFKFLAILLAFTIIARGTSGATLARVTLATPDRSEIIDSISGSATVSSTEYLEINVPELLTIAEMLVAVGQYVEAGDAIAVFDMDGLEERHTRAAANLSRLNLDLLQLEREEHTDSSPLQTAQRNLRRAQEDYASTVLHGQTEIANAQAALDLLLESAYEDGQILPSAIREHQRRLEDYYATLAQGQAAIAAAEEELRSVTVDNTALLNAIRNHQREVDDFNATIAEGQAEVAAAQETLNNLRARSPASQNRTAIENAQRAYQRTRDDYNTTRQQGENSVNAAQLALDSAIAAYHEAVWAAQLDPNPEAVAAALAEKNRAHNTLITAQETANANLLVASRRLEDDSIRLAQAQRDFAEATQNELEQAENALETAQTRAANNLLSATRRLEDMENALEQAQRNFNNSKQTEIERAENALESARDRAATDLLAAERRLQDASSSVSSEIERAQNNLQTAINRAADDRQTAARQVETARASLRTAEQTHSRSVQQTADTTAQNIISATTLQLDIASQQYTVDTLSSLISNGGVLYAGVSGSVAVAMQAGRLTNSEPIVTLRDTNGRFEAQMQISQSEAERLTIGSEVEVTTGAATMFFTPTTTGVVSAISQPDENDKVTITISLPYGNWSVGQRIDAQIILSRANYDFSVPISAVHSDNLGYFLHVMEQRSTILGLQNVVVRVNVTIVAADDMMVSVRGPVSRGSQVIVSSNRAISVGDRIRESGE